MNWADERFVRVYTRDTRNWKRMGWEARCLLVMLMRKVDRSGVLELGQGWTIEDLADEVGLPVDLVQVGLERLTETATVTTSHQAVTGVTNGHHGFRGVTIPNFLDAQETRQSDAARQRASREHRRAQAMSGHQLSPPVDLAAGSATLPVDCHQLSPTVTPSLSPSDPSFLPSDPERARARTDPGPKDQVLSRTGRSSGFAVPGSVSRNPQAPWTAPAPAPSDQVTADEGRALAAQLATALKGKQA